MAIQHLELHKLDAKGNVCSTASQEMIDPESSVFTGQRTVVKCRDETFDCIFEFLQRACDEGYLSMDPEPKDLRLRVSQRCSPENLVEL